MPARPYFLPDKLESLVRKCIVFPADGSETRVVHMIARTVTEEDPSALRMYSRCVDMTSTFGDDYRKIRVMAHRTAQAESYLFFYNLSPNLPINRAITYILEVTPSYLKTRKHLFWRGDVVVMKVQPQSEQMDFMVESLDADMVELEILEEFFRETYQGGVFGRLLHYLEYQWDSYLSDYCGPTSLLFGASKTYWGPNATEREENYLHDLNELRCIVGRPPLPRPAYMKSYTEHAVTLFSAFKSALTLPQKVTGPPKLPPELESGIFEMCARENPEMCTVLVLVARRVHVWIDPILISTVCIMEDFDHKHDRRDRLKLFLAKLTNGKLAQYYAQHVKNLAIIGAFFDNKEINDIMAICAGVQNLVLLAPTSLNFLEDPQAGRHLRRLTIKLENFSRNFGSRPDFYHPCFANITHLHLTDDDDDWPTYAGWETLVSLTHLALACSGPPEKALPLIQTLPSIQYVALGHYCGGERYKYAETTVNNHFHIRAAWGLRVVFLSDIPQSDWERGARGEGDFWDLVEREVEIRESS